MATAQEYINKITSFRKAGELDEALQLCEVARNCFPNDIWVARSIAWVHVDKMKQSAGNVDIPSFRVGINNVVSLSLPSAENMVFTAIAWHFRLLLSNIAATKSNIDFATLDLLVNDLPNIPFDTTEDAYHAMLSAALKNKTWAGLKNFLDWWNLDNLSEKDYMQNEYNGKKWMSNAEQAYLAECRCLLMQNDVNDIERYIPVLTERIEKFPQYKYLPYFKAKLLFADGKREEAIASLLPFVQKQESAFWAWRLLAEMQNDSEHKQMYYCKALQCKSSVEMTVGLQEWASLFFASIGRYELAKFLIDNAISIRKQNQWHMSPNINHILHSSWYATSVACFDKQFVNSQALLAEESVFPDLQECAVMVTYINQQKRIINFLTEDYQQGFFSFAKLKIGKISVNDVITIKAREIMVSKPTQVFRVTVADNDNPHFSCSFWGKLKKLQSGDGFADKVFVPSALCADVASGSQVVGKAVVSYDKKKDRWNWKAISIENYSYAI